MKNILEKFHQHINSSHPMSQRERFLWMANFLLCTVIVMILTFFLTSYHDLSSTVRAWITAFILLMYLCIFFSNVYLSKKLQYAIENLQQEKLYNKSLMILHDEVRAFKHDFGNIMQAIGGYIDSKDMHGLKIYYDQLFSDCQVLNNLNALTPDVVNNPAIYNILSSKYDKAQKLGITVYLNIFLNLNHLNMKIYEFSRIMGILIDNAIEAACECEEKLIHIELRKDTSRNRQLFIVENTYCEKNIDIESIFEKGFSSKPHNHGLGLWEVRQILKKNNNLNLYTSHDEHFFKQQLELYNKTK